MLHSFDGLGIIGSLLKYEKGRVPMAAQQGGAIP
jgi:hypothetical protein